MSPLKVLLVEDSLRDVQLLQLHLEAVAQEQRPRFTHVDTLAAALEHLDREGYDCVLLDLHLPDATGAACVQAVREVQRSVPIVVMTGLDDDRSATDALRCGAQEYLVKGHFNERALLRVLDYAIERQNLLLHVEQEQDKARSLAVPDSLTGLPNRHMAEQRARELLQLCARRSERFAVSVFNLAGLRAVNERHGHAVGDAALQEVAGIFNRAVRAGDTVARTGGDEFTAVLCDTADVAAAQKLIQRIVDGVRLLTSVRGRPVSLGVNCGIALYPEHGDTVEALLARAGAALDDARRGALSKVRVNTAVAVALTRAYATPKPSA